MKEQSELTWYLSKGISMFERSTIGAILDKLELESCTSRKCRKCDGQGIVDEPFTCPDPKDPARTITVQLGKWCPKCKGTAVEPVFLTPEEQKMIDSGEWSSNDKEGTRSAVPDETLVRFAHVSRMLSLMPTEHREVIEAAYGDEGDELSHGLKGRAWAVTPLTKAGLELLRSERDRKQTVGIVAPEKPVQCLVSLADLPKDKKHPERSKLLADAASEAEKMLKEAEAVWDLVVGGLSESEAK
jgi:hypothetical protein